MTMYVAVREWAHENPKRLIRPGCSRFNDGFVPSLLDGGATNMNKITQIRLKELYDLDANTGEFVRKLGKLRQGAGTPKKMPDGYVVVIVDGERYSAHRLVWLWENGSLPSGQLDHINRDRSDNRIENLREATQNQNNCNRSISKINTSGFVGVTWSKSTNKWQAQIQLFGKSFHLGTYENMSDAVSARKIAELDIHGDFAQSLQGASP